MGPQITPLAVFKISESVDMWGSVLVIVGIFSYKLNKAFVVMFCDLV